jgi:hypothetical protein
MPTVSCEKPGRREEPLGGPTLRRPQLRVGERVGHDAGPRAAPRLRMISKPHRHPNHVERAAILWAIDRRDAPEPFAWLEGATGVRLRLTVVDALVVLTVEGELDSASLGVIESTLLNELAHSPARVELDLRAVLCFGRETTGLDRETTRLASRVRARARREHVPFLLTRPTGRSRVA